MKKILTLLLCALMIFGASACGGGDETNAAGAITLKLWTPVSGSDATVYNKMITKFNREHEGDVNVVHTSAVREEHYRSLKNNIPDSGPDIAILHSQLVQNYAENRYIVPLDDSFFAKNAVSADDYLPKVMNTLYYDGSMYGIPFDVHPIVLYYNKSIVGDNALPRTYGELVALAKKLTGGGVYGMPVSTLWPSEFLFTTALFQNGGTEINAQSEPMFSSVAGIAAAQVLRDFIHKDKISPENLQADQDLSMFTTGKAAFHINGVWMLANMQEQLSDNLGVMSLSNLFAKSENSQNNEVFARSHVMCAARTKRAMSDRKKQAIGTFIKWMSENSAQWTAAGQIPAYNPARETDEYKNARFLADFGNPENFRTSAAAVYFESGYEKVFEYVTSVMKNNTPDGELKSVLDKAADEARRAVESEKNG